MKAIEKNLLALITGGLEVNGSSTLQMSDDFWNHGDFGGLDVQVGYPDTYSGNADMSAYVPQTNGYDPAAVGVQWGQPAVVSVSGHASDGNAPMTAIDGSLIGTVARVSGVAATLMVDNAIVGAEIGSAGGPWGVAAGIVVGTVVGLGAYALLQHAENAAADAKEGHVAPPRHGGEPLPEPNYF